MGDEQFMVWLMDTLKFIITAPARVFFSNKIKEICFLPMEIRWIAELPGLIMRRI